MTRVSASRCELARWQFDLTWALFEYHLERLEPADFLWEPAAVGWLRDLRRQWLGQLDRLTEADLDRAAAYPWPADSGHTVAHLLGWVDAELMKNVAEIGQLRLLRAAR
jgi:hypothetical protein